MKYKESDIAYLKKYIKENNLDDAYYQKCLKKLDKGLPIQYIIENVNFYGYPIKVNKNVLIPRFETELLVDLTIKKIKSYFPNQKVNILDLGTGSGCIAITLYKEIPSILTAIDISQKALNVAKQNAKINSANINFQLKDMTTYKENKYDVIISNPPYISYTEQIMDIVKNNEPKEALYAPNNGLYYYEKIIENIPYITNKKYLVCLEIGQSQSKEIIKIISKSLKNVTITVEKDYSKRDRFIFITNINN